MQNMFLTLTISFFFVLMLGRYNNAWACLSITDDLNLPNPTLTADFNLTPDLAPFTECWSGALRIRSRDNDWRLIATRSGPDPVISNGDPENNITANDITLKLNIDNFGMTDPNGAILLSPFNTKTKLSSIDSGTFVLSGIDKTGGSCSPNFPNYYKLTNNFCLFKDFVFNVGNYQGEVSYLLVAP